MPNVASREKQIECPLCFSVSRDIVIELSGTEPLPAYLDFNYKGAKVHAICDDYDIRRFYNIFFDDANRNEAMMFRLEYNTGPIA